MSARRLASDKTESSRIACDIVNMLGQLAASVQPVVDL